MKKKPQRKHRSITSARKAKTQPHRGLLSRADRLRGSRRGIPEQRQSAASTATKLDRLHLLIEASKIVNSTIDLDRLLELILLAATRSIGADRGTVYLLDETTGTLWSKVSQGRDMVEIRLPAGKGLAGYVAETGETVNIADAYKDPRFNPEIDRKSGYTTRNVLCMPMRNKEGVIVGTFQLLNKKRGSFTADDEAFIDALSVHASIAIENARMAQQMVQSERLSAVGRMASSIIHDIKNPMAAIRMYAQVIRRRTEDPEATHMADEMMREIDRFINMTQEILDYARGSTELRKETFRLNEAVDDSLKLIATSFARKNIEIRRAIRYDGPCTADRDKLIRVFYNLAINAADAMPEGGIFTVGTQHAGDRISVSFTDTGTGMSEEVRQRAFEPFFTYGKKHGTGLGLSIIKKIVDDHGGTIELDSELNRGTTVRLYLPAG